MHVAERVRTALPPLVLPIVLGLAATLPLLLYGPSCGHDFDFHLQSWLAVRAAWHAGLLIPHWVPGANYGAGEPRFLFYPPLTWLLGAALGLVLPWVWVPAAFTFLCFTGAAAAMQQLARRFCAPVPAAVAATLYTLSPYLLFTGYERTAYGELLAATWIPLLLGALLKQQLNVLHIALLLAALWYTNAPAAVMGCYIVLLGTIWRAIREWSHRAHREKERTTAPRKGLTRFTDLLLFWLPAPFDFLALLLPLRRNILPGLCALALGSALAADYLLPAWYGQRFVAIRRAIGPGMRIQDSFLFAHTGEAFHDQVLRTASWIAVATFATAAVAYLAFLLQRRGRANNTPPRPELLSFPAVLLTLCFLLQFPFTALVWHTLPELAFLQFPWRLLLPASAAAALLCGVALPNSRNRTRLTLSAIAIVYAAGMILWTAQTRYQPCDDEDNVPAQLTLLPANAATDANGFEGTDEYATLGTDNGEIQQDLPPVRLLTSPQADEGDDSGPGDNAANPPWKPAPQVSGSIHILRWEPENLAVTITATRPAFAVFRLERYPAWQVQLDRHPCGKACVPRDDGLLTIAIAAHQPSLITARYRTPWDVIAARIVSCIASCLAALLLAWLWRRTPSPAQL